MSQHRKISTIDPLRNLPDLYRTPMTFTQLQGEDSILNKHVNLLSNHLNITELIKESRFISEFILFTLDRGKLQVNHKRLEAFNAVSFQVGGVYYAEALYRYREVAADPQKIEELFEFN